MNLSAAVVHHGTAGTPKASLEEQDPHLAKRQLWTWKPAKDVRGHAESEARPGLKGLDDWPRCCLVSFWKIPCDLYGDSRGKPAH